MFLRIKAMPDLFELGGKQNRDMDKSIFLMEFHSL